MSFSWRDVRERKLVQWSIAYLAVAWVALQVLGFMSDAYGWSPFLVCSASIEADPRFQAVLDEFEGMRDMD